MTTEIETLVLAAGQQIPQDDWDRAPWNRWTFQNIREILPTTEVWRGEGPVWDLPYRLTDLGGIEFAAHDSSTLSVQNWLNTSYTDGFLVMHRGEIVFEQYQNGMAARSLHLSQSMAKSVTAAVAGILIGRGLLNPSEQIAHYLPELKATAWKGATLQQVMDMTSGVAYSEDYEAPNSDIAMTDIASGWKKALPGQVAPSSVWEQIISLKTTEREHGALFHYRSIETDVLAHCLERVTETRLSDLISRELWQPLGCEQSANFTVDPAGYSLACGGLSASLRDYARFGQMLLQRGDLAGHQIVPAAWIDDIHNADPNLFGEPYTFASPNGAYRNQFWIDDVNRSAFMARGVFGQLIYVDPDSQMVVVKLSTWPEFVSVQRLRTKLNAIHAIAAVLNA